MLKLSKYPPKGFTLIELLVVVLIIGILAAIALPQYRKVVLKARLHTGVSLVESLYEAAQGYYLVNGVYSNDIDSLDIEMPKSDSCERWESGDISGWDCYWGGVETSVNYINFIYPVHSSTFNSTGQMNYAHFLQDVPNGSVPKGKFEQGKRYCFARPYNEIAQAVCQEIGGVLIGENGAWKYYEIQ